MLSYAQANVVCTAARSRGRSSNRSSTFAAARSSSVVNFRFGSGSMSACNCAAAPARPSKSCCRNALIARVVAASSDAFCSEALALRSSSSARCSLVRASRSARVAQTACQAMPSDPNTSMAATVPLASGATLFRRATCGTGRSSTADRR